MGPVYPSPSEELRRRVRTRAFEEESLLELERVVIVVAPPKSDMILPARPLIDIPSLLSADMSFSRRLRLMGEIGSWYLRPFSPWSLR